MLPSDGIKLLAAFDWSGMQAVMAWGSAALGADDFAWDLLDSRAKKACQVMVRLNKIQYYHFKFN